MVLTLVYKAEGGGEQTRLFVRMQNNFVLKLKNNLICKNYNCNGLLNRQLNTGH